MTTPEWADKSDLPPPEVTREFFAGLERKADLAEVCSICGAMVLDTYLHDKFHEPEMSQERSVRIRASEYPPQDFRHLHYTNRKGNCKHPDCDFNQYDYS